MLWRSRQTGGGIGRELAGHLVRRTALGVNPATVERLAGSSWDSAVDSVLGAADAWRNGDAERAPVSDDWETPLVWWMQRMTDADTGLIDRMAWFWHGLLTTSIDKVDADLLGPQIDLLRTNAVGNFRTLLQAFVIDPALLQFLDGDGSSASNPNENLARELMELFTLGRSSNGEANYSQDDVRAAARALAGWRIVYESPEEDDAGDGESGNDRVIFDRMNAFNGPLIYLGEQADWDTAMVVDRLCDDPRTHARIVARLWRHLVGTWLDDAASSELGQFWADNDLEIRPLVERILRSEEFRQARFNRPRTGIEWWCAHLSALGHEQGGDLWGLNSLSQMPYRPPNVAGWPDDDRWLSAGSLLARAAQVWNVDPSEHFADLPGDPQAILDRCVLHGAAESTIVAITEAGLAQADAAETGATEMSDEAVRALRWRIALTSPEFNLA